MATPPWKRKKPANGGSKITLTAESIAWARDRASRAGRRYPNLVDNMAAAQRQQQAGRPAADRDRP